MKLLAGLSKKQKASLRKRLADLDKQLDAELEDALQATIKAIESGVDVKGCDEDPKWWKTKTKRRRKKQLKPK